MKILVFSDTHGYTSKMHEIISRKRADSDRVIHLGDHYRDVEEVSRDFPAIAFLGVRGNCDFLVNDNYPQSRTFAYDGHKFFLTHGNMQAVKHDSYALLTLEAKKNGCDRMDLDVWEFNDGARRFYERWGFATQKRRMDMWLK